jgi:diaminohydroxyphosphoribosylaminopyrimidine deaminase/5-amino-6-(5-phosphoribosylamino)uracil reductase
VSRKALFMLDIESAWQALLEISETYRTGAVAGAAIVAPLPCGVLTVLASGDGSLEPPAAPDLAAFLELYLPYCLASRRRGFVIGHLGQSLDGRIATESGASRWITGEADVVHNHRMRALADAVLVGAATLRCDDPQLTVRGCSGRNPVRVVLDTNGTLDDTYRVFRDATAPTLVLAAEDKVRPGQRIAGAEIIALPCDEGGIAPAAIRAALGRRGLTRLFVEGGGVTVSRFLAAGCLDRLQITVSPLILGSGRASITLPAIDDVRAGLRPRMRRFDLGEDIMFEALFEANDRDAGPCDDRPCDARPRDD